MTRAGATPPGGRPYVTAGIALLAAAGALLLLWQLKHVVLLTFGGLIFASALHALAAWLQRVSGMGYRACFVFVAGLVFAGGLVGAWFVGAAVVEQLMAMRDQLPQAIEAFKRWVAGKPFGPRLLELWGDGGNQRISIDQVFAAAGLTLEALGKFSLMLLLGVFIAAEPTVYRRGTLALVPARYKQLAGGTLDACRDALARWLRGQGLSMIFVGVATGAGLKLLGVPLALTLGLIAGTLAFVPFFGAIGSGLLAVLLAFSEGPRTALYVAVLCVAIQQVEGHVLIPLIQRWSVKLAPVLSLLAVVIFGGLFGLLGVLLAAPLMVMLVVLVDKLYVEHTLGGEHA
jgi:predicted PurR-regulated permease PerM